jgi:hypothetical protein
MRKNGITTYNQVVMFLAQTGHEYVHDTKNSTDQDHGSINRFIPSGRTITTPSKSTLTQVGPMRGVISTREAARILAEAQFSSPTNTTMRRLGRLSVNHLYPGPVRCLSVCFIFDLF